MLKSFPLVFAGILLALAPAGSPALGPSAQDAPPAQPQPAAPAPMPAPAVAPAPAAAPVPAVAYPKNPIRPTTDSQAKAKSLYQIDCAMCHGDNGNGKTDLATSMDLTLADWTDAKTLADKPDGELFSMIRNGKDKMPPEAEARAKDDQVWNLVIYIRSFSKGQQSAASAAK